MIIDTTSHNTHYNDCIVGDFTLPTSEVDLKLEVRIGPNPAHEFLLINAPYLLVRESNFILIDLLGKVLFQTVITDQNSKLDLPISLPSGIYYGRLESGKAASSWQRIAVVR
jgi:hypothetical protein